MQRTLTSLTENICESYIKKYFHISYIYGIRQLRIFFAINIILHWYLKRQLQLDENLLKIFASPTLKIIFILAIYGIRQLQIFFALNIILHWYLNNNNNS